VTYKKPISSNIYIYTRAHAHTHTHTQNGDGTPKKNCGRNIILVGSYAIFMRGENLWLCVTDSSEHTQNKRRLINSCCAEV